MVTDATVIKPAAAVIPKSDPSWEQGKYGPIWPKTPANYGFTIIARVKPGCAEVIRQYGEGAGGSPVPARPAEAPLPALGAVR